MELRVMASISNCPGMIQVFKDGKDPHCYVTRMVFPDIIPAAATDREIKANFLEYRYT
jgi:DNA polymerase I-like protein with 3'-5' exonuclease and polymerase domains